MLKIRPEQFEVVLKQTSHLLDGIEEEFENDERIKKEIEDLRSQIRGLLYLQEAGMALSVEVGVEIFGREVDKFVLGLKRN
jgi:hypothetical protein